MFIDLGPGREPPQLTPIVAEGPKPRLLELADVYAYTAVQANAGKAGWRTRWFQELYALIGPERAVFEPNPDVRWEDARANGAR